MNNIVIIGGARDYHAVDWYRTIRKFAHEREVILLTDLIDSEGYTKIIDNSDTIAKLFIIDRFLFRKQSKIGNMWRNALKLFVLPLQIFYLKDYAKKNPNSIFHAHPMYYMLLCWLAKVEYIGTPQGSEILVRPKKSKIYKYFAKKSLQRAKYITVDSMNMKNEVFSLSGVDALVIQYGIDTGTLLSFNNIQKNKSKIISLRGMSELYRIEEIILARNNSLENYPIEFIYPFSDEGYKQKIRNILKPNDKDLGRLSKEKMYNKLSEAMLVISIPKSDSSPRSVYEAIFLGACVAVTYNSYIEILPVCMRERLFIVDLEDPEWFVKAIEYGKNIIQKKFVPSEEAINIFDQNISMKKAIEILY